MSWWSDLWGSDDDPSDFESADFYSESDWFDTSAGSESDIDPDDIVDNMSSPFDD